MPVEKIEKNTDKLIRNFLEIEFRVRPKSSICLVCLHEDEVVAYDVAEELFERFPVSMLRLFGQGRRNFFFDEKERRFSFDPNRMFNTFSLTRSQKLPINIARTVKRGMANPIMSALDQFPFLISLHNNGKTNFSLNTFAENPNAIIIVKERQKLGDFILTNDRFFFDRIKEKCPFNSALLEYRCETKGSLAYFKKSHFNVEVKSRCSLGETREKQLDMAEMLIKLIQNH
ncbi:MAG: hypothetical protein HY764_04600 [Candidatus Portnoybacteria bacterium]|nr:hypothetical protein [Candidatus Portnoybacteria bacterium]